MVDMCFLDIDAYHKGQGWEETCSTNAWDNLTTLRITAQFSGGVEAFINQWDEGLEEVIELGWQQNELLEKTLFKDSVQDIYYTPILAGLDMMEPHDRIENEEMWWRSEVQTQGPISP